MIVENDCLILQIFQMSDGETREEVPMNVMIQKPTEREVQRVQANREELVERVERAIREDGTVQPLQGLHLYRHSFPLERVTAWSSRPCAWLPRGARSSSWARAATGTTPSTIFW